MQAAALPSVRKVAANSGHNRYFTGKVCKNGHISERDTKTGKCMECSRMWDRTLVRDWKQRNRARYNAIEKVRAVETRRRRRLEAIEALGGKCVRCGFKNELALQFDHIKPLLRRTNNLPRGGTLKPNEYEAIVPGNGTHDIQLLCANCHAIKSKTEDKTFH